MSFTTQRSLLNGNGFKDEDSCAEFYRIYAPLIRMYGRESGIKEDDLDDLVQSVTISFCRDGFHYDPAKGHFRTLLRRVIKSKAYDILRGKYRQKNLVEKLPAQSEIVSDRRFDREYAKTVLAEAAKQLKHSVPPMHYQIFNAFFHNRGNVGETAENYHLSPSSVYSILARTKEKYFRIAREISRMNNF